MPDPLLTQALVPQPGAQNMVGRMARGPACCPLSAVNVDPSVSVFLSLSFVQLTASIPLAHLDSALATSPSHYYFARTMSISHFSLYEGSSSQPSDFLSKVLKPRFWQKRKTSAPPPALDFATPKKGLGRWFGISASESKQPARQISEPRYIEDPHDEYAREFAEPAQ